MSWADKIADLLDRDPQAVWKCTEFMDGKRHIVKCVLVSEGRRIENNLPVTGWGGEELKERDVFWTELAKCECLGGAVDALYQIERKAA